MKKLIFILTFIITTNSLARNCENLFENKSNYFSKNYDRYSLTIFNLGNGTPINELDILVTDNETLTPKRFKIDFPGFNYFGFVAIVADHLIIKSERNNWDLEMIMIDLSKIKNNFMTLKKFEHYPYESTARFKATENLLLYGEGNQVRVLIFDKENEASKLIYNRDIARLFRSNAEPIPEVSETENELVIKIGKMSYVYDKFSIQFKNAFYDYKIKKGQVLRL